MSQKLFWHSSTRISVLQKNIYIISETALHSQSNPWHKKATNKIFDENFCSREHKSRTGPKNLLGQKELQQSFKLWDFSKTSQH